MIYIIDGKRKWWSDRRIKLAITIGVLIGFILGLIVGHVLGILHATETIARANSFYRELVLRGDAAMAMLVRVNSEIDRLVGSRRTIIPSDLDACRKAIDVGVNKRIVKAEG